MNHILHIRVHVYVLEICFGQWDSNSVCLGAIWLLWSICVKSRYTAIKQTSGNTAYQHAKTQWRNSVGNIIACGMNPKRYHMCIDESGRKKYAAEESVIWCICRDDVIKGKHFPRHWSFVWGSHRSPVNSPHKGQRRGVLMFSLFCAWTNDWLTIETLVIWDAIAPIMTSL